MRLSKPLVSALRALSTVPDLGLDELKRFSDSIDDVSPMPDGSYGAEPIWRIANGTAPPPYFAALIDQLRNGAGLVAHGDYFAFELAEVAVVITDHTLDDIVGSAANEPLTTAETRLARLLLQGQDLRAAAQSDGTSYETKRSQFKALSAKLGLRGQSEVVRLLTSHMLKKLAPLAQPQRRNDLETYATAYLPAEVRRLTLNTPQGHSVPVLDYGPVTGRPIVVLHPMIFPAYWTGRNCPSRPIGPAPAVAIACGAL